MKWWMLALLALLILWGVDGVGAQPSQQEEPTETPTLTPSPAWRIGGETEGGDSYYIYRSATWGDIAEFGILGGLCILGFVRMTIAIMRGRRNEHPFWICFWIVSGRRDWCQSLAVPDHGRFVNGGHDAEYVALMAWFDGFQQFFTVVYGPLVFFGTACLVVSSLVIAIILALKSLLWKEVINNELQPGFEFAVRIRGSDIQFVRADDCCHRRPDPGRCTGRVHSEPDQEDVQGLSIIYPKGGTNHVVLARS
jgi:hypothetical protein